MSRCGCADADMRSIFGYCARCGGTTSHRVDVNKVVPPGAKCTFHDRENCQVFSCSTQRPDMRETFDPELLAKDHADAALAKIGIERGKGSAVGEVFAIVERAWFAGYAAGLAKR